MKASRGLMKPTFDREREIAARTERLQALIRPHRRLSLAWFRERLGPSTKQQLAATQDMLDDARAELRDLRDALGVPFEPHQTLRERTLKAAVHARRGW